MAFQQRKHPKVVLSASSQVAHQHSEVTALHLAPDRILSFFWNLANPFLSLSYTQGLSLEMSIWCSSSEWDIYILRWSAWNWSLTLNSNLLLTRVLGGRSAGSYHPQQIRTSTQLQAPLCCSLTGEGHRRNELVDRSSLPVYFCLYVSQINRF